MKKQYRVWDKVAEKMYYVGDCKFSIDLSGSLYDDSQTPPLNIDYRCVLMEDTGLTDKNGKRIFKGDVVKGTKYGKPIQLVVKWAHGFEGDSWPIAGYYFEIDEDDDFDNIPELTWSEVIGNIYQHPELLQE